MLKVVQIACLLTVGVDVVLFVVWGHRTGKTDMVIMAWSAFVGYLGLLPRLFNLNDRENGVFDKCITRVFTICLGDPRRASFLFLISLATCGLLVWLHFMSRVVMVIVVKPKYLCEKSQAETKPCRFKASTVILEQPVERAQMNQFRKLSS